MLGSEYIFKQKINAKKIHLFEESTLISLDNLVINKALKDLHMNFSHMYMK